MLIYQFSVFIHILAAAVWVGGMAFIALALVPVLRREENKGQAMRLIRETGHRFRTVGWVSMGVLILTGMFNMHFRGWLTAGVPFWTGTLGNILSLKIMLVLVMFILSGIHDFYVGPGATNAWREDPTSEKAMHYRKAASYMGRVNMLLALVVIALAVILVRGWPLG